jgi:FeS assembly SUF system regulator
MLRLNKLTDYAVVILAQMSQDQSDGQALRYTSANLAGMTAVPEPTVAKILKDLAKSDLVTSYRGSQGGYTLARAGNTITVRHVIEAVEGPITMVECVDASSTCCTTEKKCPLRGRWDIVNAAIIGQLDNITLADMLRPTLVRIAAE